MSAPRPPLRLVGQAPAQVTDDDGLSAAHPERRAGTDEDGVRSLSLVVDAGAIDEEPEASIEPPPNAAPVRFVVVALIAFQAMVALSYSGRYATLTRGGDEYGVAALLSVPASLCLYVGALLLAWRPGRGRALFMVAAVGLGLSLPAWGLSASWSWPMAFGAMLGLAGAWYARAEVTVDDASAAQP